MCISFTQPFRAGMDFSIFLSNISDVWSTVDIQQMYEWINELVTGNLKDYNDKEFEKTFFFEKDIASPLFHPDI